MLYSETVAACSEIHTKHINTLCGQNVELLKAKPGGTHSNECAQNNGNILLQYLTLTASPWRLAMPHYTWRSHWAKGGPRRKQGDVTVGFILRHNAEMVVKMLWRGLLIYTTIILYDEYRRHNTPFYST
jgi:hypothetical protein